MRVGTRCAFRGLCGCGPTSRRKRRTRWSALRRSTSSRSNTYWLQPSVVTARQATEACLLAVMVVMLLALDHRNHAAVGHFADCVFELNRRVVDAEVAQ